MKDRVSLIRGQANIAKRFLKEPDSESEFLKALIRRFERLQKSDTKNQTL
jgi:hypothetical protein